MNNATTPAWLHVHVQATAGATQNVQGDLYLPPATETYTHDPDGNLIQDGLWTLGWDGENRLISAQPTAAAVAAGAPNELQTFAYDARGRRISKKASRWENGNWVFARERRYLYDGWNLIAELNVEPPTSTTTWQLNNGVLNWTPPNSYISPRLQYQAWLWANGSYTTTTTPELTWLVDIYTWGLDLSGSLQGAGGVGGLLAVQDMFTQGVTHFTVVDGNGNVAALMHAQTGVETARYDYGPFGELLRATGPMARVNPFRFSTKFQDEETSWLYYGYRYYDASTGRWLSRDPIEENGGLNINAFDGNNPIHTLDINGLVKLQEYDQRAQSLVNEGGFWNNTKALGIHTKKAAFIIFSLGSVCKNDRLADRNLAGEISDGQYWAGTSVNTGVALASVATGGVVANAVAKAGGGLVLQGAASGFASSTADVLGTRGGYLASGIKYEGTLTGDMIQIGTGTAFGTAFGGGAAAIQKAGPALERLNMAVGDDLAEILQKLLPKKGEVGVYGHGDSTSISLSSSGEEFSATMLAKLLKQYGIRRDVRLFACECGQGVNSMGSRLARQMWVVVRAPSKKLWVYKNSPGFATIADGIQTAPNQWQITGPIGEWATFSPFNLYFLYSTLAQMSRSELMQNWPHYWYGYFSDSSSGAAGGLPLLDDIVDPAWKHPQLDMVITYLRTAPNAPHCPVLARRQVCSICGEKLPYDGDHTDGTWVWPSILPHLVERHSVPLPSGLIKHMESRGFRPPESLPKFMHSLPKPPIGTLELSIWRKLRRFFFHM